MWISIFDQYVQSCCISVVSPDNWHWCVCVWSQVAPNLIDDCGPLFYWAYEVTVTNTMSCCVKLFFIFLERSGDCACTCSAFHLWRILYYVVSVCLCIISDPAGLYDICKNNKQRRKLWLLIVWVPFLAQCTDASKAQKLLGVVILTVTTQSSIKLVPGKQSGLSPLLLCQNSEIAALNRDLVCN